jgi:hypothetical protein
MLHPMSFRLDSQCPKRNVSWPQNNSVSRILGVFAGEFVNKGEFFERSGVLSTFRASSPHPACFL